MWSLLAAWTWAALAFPVVGVVVAFAGGAVPRVARFGFGPHRSLGVLWGVDWQVGCLPMGSFVSFGEDVPPPAWVGFVTHGVVGVPCLLAGLWLAPEHLAGAARITWAWVSFGRSPTGGPIGTLGHLWRSEPDDVTGYVLATLTTLAGWNLALVLGQAAASRVPRSGIVGAVLYAAWAGWAVWLDWTA